MGYAELSQSGEGIHTRQYSRAYIFSKGGNRLVYVVADIQAVGVAVRRGVSDFTIRIIHSIRSVFKLKLVLYYRLLCTNS